MHTNDNTTVDGFCQCGCGQPTKRADKSCTRAGYEKGQFRRFVPGHARCRMFREEGPNPSGLCMCGCGEKTRIATATDKRTGAVSGKPIRYVNGHVSRIDPDEWRIEDRGYEQGPCWIWKRGMSGNGYGTAVGKDGKTTTAHRVVYERIIGPIPFGLVLDHLCRQKDCVNPAHLDPVTNHENLKRGELPVMVAHLNGTCVKGHAMEGDNVYTYPNGRRACKKCM